MVLLTQFRLEKAVRISRPFCRLPKNAQNLHQPTYSHLLPELDAEPLVHPLFACIRRIRGVQAKRELKELRRDYDSTGLRAALQLITPLLRCASLAKHACFQRASEATQSKTESGEPPGSPCRCVPSRSDSLEVKVLYST